MNILKSFFTSDLKNNTRLDSLASLAFLQSPVATVLTNDKGTILNINNSFSLLMGYSELDSLGKNMSMMKSGKHNNAFYKTFHKNLYSLNKHTLQIKNRCKNGSILLLKESISKINVDSNEYFIIAFEDITEQNRLVERQEYLATHDPLTGLANRTLLKDRFKHAISNATRSRDKVAVLMCDLNEFKQINDNHGHHIGDITLQKVAQKLESLVRGGDTISRFGGDEFLIVLEQLKNIEEIRKVVSLLKNEFPISFNVNDEEYEIGMSIGYSHFPEEGTTFEQLTAQADRKMYKEKDLYYGME